MQQHYIVEASYLPPAGKIISIGLLIILYNVCIVILLIFWSTANPINYHHFGTDIQDPPPKKTPLL